MVTVGLGVQPDRQTPPHAPREPDADGAGHGRVQNPGTSPGIGPTKSGIPNVFSSIPNSFKKVV